MVGWRVLGLFAALALPVGSSRLLSRGRCERKGEPDWLRFRTAIELSGLAGEDGISNLAADLRTGALSLSVPLSYAIVGGGEWGPRVVAKALLESVYVDWVNDVYLLDMEEAKSYLRPDNGFVEAQTWFNEHLCKAIERCPRKAVVVLDNVHLLEGEEIWLLDKMLSLTDGEKTNMECGDHKVSAERCLFLMLLNEDGLDENKRKSGKDRLTAAWEFKGVAFTTEAFVGRIDIAVSLSRKPQLLPAEMKAAWEQAGALPTDRWEDKVRKQVMAAWDATDRGTLRAIGLSAAAATMLAAACFKLGCFQAATPKNAREAGGTAGTATGNTGTGSIGGGGGGDGGRVLDVRGGGAGGTPPATGRVEEEEHEKEIEEEEEIEDQEDMEEQESDALLEGESGDESRSTEDEACHASRAPQLAANPLGAPASRAAAAAVTGTAKSSPGSGRDGAGEAVAKTLPRRSTRKRRSTIEAAGKGDWTA